MVGILQWTHPVRSIPLNMKRLLILSLALLWFLPLPLAAQNSEGSTAPASSEAQTQEEPQDIVYIAKWYDTLESIAEHFNVSKEVLMAYNGLTSEKIGRRQKILIPAHPERVKVSAPVTVETVEQAEETAGEGAQETTEQTEETLEDAPADTLQGLAERIGWSLRDLFRKKQPHESVSVAVILPFNAKGAINHNAFDLYSGMLLALRDLDKDGIKATLDVLDSKNPAFVPDHEALAGKDLVIGPIAPEDLAAVLEGCPRTMVVVSPLDPKAAVLVEDHPNFIQAPSPAEAQYQDIIEWIRDDFETGDRILLIREKDEAPTPLAACLEASGLEYTTLELTPYEARSAADRILPLAPKNGTLHALVASDKETFVNEAVQQLSFLTYKNIDIVFYGPARVRTFDLIEVENLHRVNAHLSCSYFIDYNSARVKDFLLGYRALFGAEPTQFAYQGYDAAWYFIRNFSTAERDRERMTRLEDRKYRGLQSDFLISDEYGERGHVNRAVRRVVYGVDYTISLLNR